MRKLTFIFLFTTLITTAQTVVISEAEADPDASSILDVQSSSKGMLVPRMTQDQRELISSPATGLLVYQTDEVAAFYFFNGVSWIPLLDGNEEDPSFSTSEANNISDAGSGAVITEDERRILQRVDTLSLVPPGTIMPFAGPVGNIPAGWLLCDGQAYANATYPELSAAIGTFWGGSSDIFNVPDLRGHFLRGLDDRDAENDDLGASERVDVNGNTVGAVVGSYQGEATKLPSTNFTGSTSTNGAHTHTYKFDAFEHRAGTGNSNDNVFDNDNNTNATTSSAGNHSHTVTITGGGDQETRPKNASVNYIIKY